MTTVLVRGRSGFKEEYRYSGKLSYAQAVEALPDYIRKYDVCNSYVVKYDRECKFDFEYDYEEEKFDGMEFEEEDVDIEAIIERNIQEHINEELYGVRNPWWE